MSLAHGILGFLSYGKMSGYDLAKTFTPTAQFFWSAQNSQIYLELEKLEKKKLVKYRVVEQKGRPDKKMYSITEKGKEEFLRWLSESNSGSDTGFKSSFLMKVFFSVNQSKEETKHMLSAFISDLARYLEEMEPYPAILDQMNPDRKSEASLYWEFTSDFARSYLEMCKQWAERCIATLGA